MLNLYVFGSRMLNRILKDVNGTSIVTIDSEMLLTNTINMEEFLHPKEFGATATGNNVLSFSSG